MTSRIIPRHGSWEPAGDVDDIYDIRLTPTFYTIGADGNIISKNITVDEAVRQALENIKQ